MVAKIGHARSDENSKAKGGKAGDQTGNEILIQDWYLIKNGWSAVFRAKNSTVAEKIARAMEQACENNNIGYDQGQRTTLYECAKKYNWDLTKITEKCECDCSSLVAVCVTAAGVPVSKDLYTGNQKAILQTTGKFDILVDQKYLTKSDSLKRGDILLATGHTAIVVSNDVQIQPTESAKSFLRSLAGTYKVTASKLNIRCGAGTNNPVLITIPKGTEVKCYGYFTSVTDTDWLYVQFTYNKILYTGFASNKYLTK